MELELRTIVSLTPEIVLLSAAVLIMVGGAFVRSTTGWVSVAVVSILAAAIFLFRQVGPPWHVNELYETGLFAFDTLANTLRWVALAFGGGFVLMMSRHASRDGGGEALGMLLVAVAGVMLSACSADIVGLFLALELISIPTYVLLFLGRRGSRSAEAAVKYFFLSILSSAFFLMGMAILFGLGGTTNIDGIGEAVAALNAAESGGRAAMLAMILVVASLGFKVTAVPFHFYAPDVYLATSNLNAGLLAVLPKVAGFVALTRLSNLLTPALPGFGWQLIVILAILTMTIGNIGALMQKNVRRLMAYSSIAHSGYMLIGISVGLAGLDGMLAYGGFAAAFLYLFVYGLASIGTFAALSDSEFSESDAGGVSGLAGLSRSRPWMAGMIGICMFSLAGLPPLAGFWGKLTLFSAALTAYRSVDAGVEGAGDGTWFLVLAIVGVLNAVIAAAYYLRIVASMYFDGNDRREDGAVGLGAVAALACGAAVVLCGLMPGRVVDHFRATGPAARPIVQQQVEQQFEQPSREDRSVQSPTPAALPINSLVDFDVIHATRGLP